MDFDSRNPIDYQNIPYNEVICYKSKKYENVRKTKQY